MPRATGWALAFAAGRLEVAAWALAIRTAGLADWVTLAGLADTVFAPALRAAVLAAADLTLADLRVVVLATLDFLIPTAKPPRWIAHSRLPARKRGTFYFISPWI